MLVLVVLVLVSVPDGRRRRICVTGCAVVVMAAAVAVNVRLIVPDNHFLFDNGEGKTASVKVGHEDSALLNQCYPLRFRPDAAKQSP